MYFDNAMNRHLAPARLACQHIIRLTLSTMSIIYVYETDRLKLKEPFDKYATRLANYT